MDNASRKVKVIAEQNDWSSDDDSKALFQNFAKRASKKIKSMKKHNGESRKGFGGTHHHSNKSSKKHPDKR